MTRHRPPQALAHSFLYSEELDLPPYQGPPQKFICLHFVPRSGSNMLADLMRQTGSMGFPLEYFSPANMAMLAARLPGLSLSDLTPLFGRRTSPNGVFSFKWNSDFQGLVAEAKAVAALGPRVNIFIDRRDQEAQARSYLVAGKTGVWAERRGVSYERQGVTLSPDELDEARAKLAGIRAHTLQLVESEQQPFLTVFAEDLFEQPARTLAGVMEFCRIDPAGSTLPSASIYTSPSS